MLNLNDFEEKDTVYSYTYLIEGKPDVRLYIQQSKKSGLDENKGFQIVGYGKGARSKSISSVKTLKEVENIITEFCKDLEIAYTVTEHPNLQKFLEKQSEKYPNQIRNKRYSLFSDNYEEDKVKMYVKSDVSLFNGKGGFIPMVQDLEINSNEIRTGYLHWAVPTFDEAKCIVDCEMDKFRLNGYYDRKWKRLPDNQFRFEGRTVNPKQEILKEEYSITNLSKPKYEFLITQAELFDKINNMEML